MALIKAEKINLEFATNDYWALKIQKKRNYEKNVKFSLTIFSDNLINKLLLLSVLNS